MSNKRRDKQILRLRESGLTYSHIAHMFGLTGIRIRQIYFREKWLKKNFISFKDKLMSGQITEETPIYEIPLSVRSANSLEYFFESKIEGTPTIGDILKNRDSLWKVKNIGPKSLKEINNLLDRCGFKR